MVRFIDTHRGEYGVEPICAVLPIAPSMYYEAKARERTPERRPGGTRRDEALAVQVERVWREHRAVYGVRKVWKQLGRGGTPSRGARSPASCAAAASRASCAAGASG